MIWKLTNKTVDELKIHKQTRDWKKKVSESFRCWEDSRKSVLTGSGGTTSAKG